MAERGAQGATGSQEEQTATREARLHALATMEARATKLQAELDSHKENNPEHFNRLSVCPVRRVLVLGRLPQVMVETLPYGFAGTSPSEITLCTRVSCCMGPTRSLLPACG